MNSAIHYNARPGDIRDLTARSSSCDAAAFAKSMGVDFSQYGEQIDSYWKMLDDLHASDSKAYNSFISETMSNAKKEKIRAEPHFFPVPGFAIETSVLKFCSHGEESEMPGVKILRYTQGTRIFVNFASHESLETPLDATHARISPDSSLRASAEGLQIPLAISPPRLITFDVVVHPWVMRCCLKSTLFHTQLIELALRWIERDKSLSKSIQLSREFQIVKGKKYVNGNGKDGSDPVPFLVQIDSEVDDNSKCKPNATDEKKTKFNNVGVIDNPKNLLSALKNEKVLDIESTSNKTGTSTISKVTEKMSTESKKESIKKGFLQNCTQGNSILYPNGSNEGGKEGTYSKFISKCQIVDISNTPKGQTQDVKSSKNCNSMQSKNVINDSNYDKLLAAADPELQVLLNSSHEEPAAEFFNDLGNFSGLLNGKAVTDKESCSENVKNVLKSNSKATECSIAKELKYLLEQKGNYIIVRVNLEKSIENIEDVKLDVSSSEFKLKVPGKSEMRFSFPFLVDTTKISATHSARKKEMVVKIQRLS